MRRVNLLFTLDTDKCDNETNKWRNGVFRITTTTTRWRKKRATGYYELKRCHWEVSNKYLLAQQTVYAQFFKQMPLVH